MIEKLVPVDGGYEDADGVYWANKADYLCQKVLPACDCVDGLSVARYVANSLRIYSCEDVGSPKRDPIKYGPDVLFFMCWASREGFIEHGSTIYFSWLTAKGMELLKDIDQILAEDK